MEDICGRGDIEVYWDTSEVTAARPTAYVAVKLRQEEQEQEEELEEG